MNRIFFSAVVLALALVVGCGDKHDKRLDTDLMNTDTKDGVNDTNGGAKIIFQDMGTVDLGEIAEGGELKYTFNFRNEGEKDLILSTVKPGCGCTTTDYTREPVKKGQSGFIKIVFDSKDKGPKGDEKSVMVEKTVEVSSNSLVNNPYVLRFRVHITK